MRRGAARFPPSDDSKSQRTSTANEPASRTRVTAPPGAAARPAGTTGARQTTRATPWATHPAFRRNRCGRGARSHGPRPAGRHEQVARRAEQQNPGVEPPAPPHQRGQHQHQDRIELHVESGAEVGAGAGAPGHEPVDAVEAEGGDGHADDPPEAGVRQALGVRHERREREDQRGAADRDPVGRAQTPGQGCGGRRFWTPAAKRHIGGHRGRQVVAGQLEPPGRGAGHEQQRRQPDGQLRGHPAASVGGWTGRGAGGGAGIV